MKLPDYAPSNSFQNQGRFLAERVEQELNGAKSCSIVGYSAGGFLAWELAASLRVRTVCDVDFLILLDRNPYAPTQRLLIEGLADLADLEDKVPHLDAVAAQTLTALVSFAMSVVGVDRAQLRRLAEELVVASREGRDLYEVFERNLGPAPIQSGALDIFVRSFRRTRPLIAHYVPTPLDGRDVRKVLVHPEEAAPGAVPSDVMTLAVPDCDHFTILTSPNLKAAMVDWLGGQEPRFASTEPLTRPALRPGRMSQ
jgi:pimeloyl-ACP methyl ester carboxylesterase